MQFKRIETPGISHFAYLLANADGDGLLVDPRRDVDDYLSVAREMAVRIRYIVETHRQEDFVMGSAHLAGLTGAKVIAGDHELFGRTDIRLEDGETFDLGEIRLRALHTPGHTPESMSYAVYATQEDEVPWGVFTGDTLFFGETGRTDLADPNRTQENGALLYDVVHQKLAPLGDTVSVLPAHGPGSVCGSGMMALPSSTLGAERKHNPVFTLSREEFANKKAGERLPRPPYFRHMEKVNLEGGLVPRGRPDAVPLLRPDAFAQGAEEHTCFDTREPEAYAGGHVRDAYAIWLGGLPVFGGWMAQPETEIYLLTDRNADVATAFVHLSRIGLDRVQGALSGGFGAFRQSGRPVFNSLVMTPRELVKQRAEVQILDVRDPDEFASGHIPEARNRYVGDLRESLAELNLEMQRPIVVTCSVGHRAGLAVSILRRAGYADVRNLLGGMKAWQALDLPTEQESSREEQQ